jgi:hypothetical protein
VFQNSFFLKLFLAQLFQRGDWQSPAKQSPDSSNYNSALQRFLLNPWGREFCCKLRDPHRGTSLGPFVCGAKKFFGPELRTTQAAAAAASLRPPLAAAGGECAICLDPNAFAEGTTLPCGHFFFPACVAGLWSFGVKQM